MAHGNSKVFGICNATFFPTRPEGTETWYATREARDLALDSLRERAIAAGMSEGAARAGICPITETLAVLRREHDGHHVRCDDGLLAEVV